MNNTKIVSSKTLQVVIGVLAILFAFLLIAGTRLASSDYPPSLSQTAWTNAHVIFEGLLVTFCITLWCYSGYNLHDRIITAIAGTAMGIVALFPCEGDFSGVVVYLFQMIPQNIVAIIHYSVAGIAFSSMGYMAAFLFTKGDSGTKQKKVRNVIYWICGYGIFACIAGMILVQAGGLRPKTGHLFWWLESAVVMLFGFSWLVKSGIIFADKDS